MVHCFSLGKKPISAESFTSGRIEMWLLQHPHIGGMLPSLAAYTILIIIYENIMRGSVIEFVSTSACKDRQE